MSEQNSEARKIDAWMPLWIGDYLADTQHLTRDEHGAYLLLLMAYWRNGGPLSDDDKRLAATVKASPKEWRNLRETMAEFFTVFGGVWSHKRADKEIAESMSRSEKNASRASRAAQARWGKSGQSAQPSDDAPSIPQALHEQCPSPSPSPISSSLRSEDGKRSQGSHHAAKPEGVSDGVWTDFQAIRKAKRAPLTATALEGIEREATKAGMNLADVLALCCTRGWQGFKAEWVATAVQQSAKTGKFDPVAFVNGTRTTETKYLRPVGQVFEAELAVDANGGNP